jgi:hypothetical protein
MGWGCSRELAWYVQCGSGLHPQHHEKKRRREGSMKARGRKERGREEGRE